MKKGSSETEKAVNKLATSKSIHRQTDDGVPILSFFTGAGFLDIGFMRAGFKTIWSNENNTFFIEGFARGMSSLTGHEVKIENPNSIIDVGPDQIAKEAFRNTGMPSIFGIVGGPPCPDFSVGGKNRGGEGDRGKLSAVYVSRIVDLQPTFFLLENVPGLLRTKKHLMFFQGLIRQLTDHYVLDLSILNALEHGVPQDRERVFLVGFRRKWLKSTFGLSISPYINDWLLRPILSRTNATLPGMNHPNWFPWPNDDRYMLAKSRFDWPMRDPFGSDPEKPKGIPDELMVYQYICNSEELAGLPNHLEGFTPKSKKFSLIREGDDSRKSFKRLHRWRYSPAAAYGNNEVHLHPTYARRLTVREAMRIQTVPDKYELPASMPLSHKFKTIGNGVPVKLAESVAHSIQKVLKGDFNGNF